MQAPGMAGEGGHGSAREGPERQPSALDRLEPRSRRDGGETGEGVGVDVDLAGADMGEQGRDHGGGDRTCGAPADPRFRPGLAERGESCHRIPPGDADLEVFGWTKRVGGIGVGGEQGLGIGDPPPCASASFGVGLTLHPEKTRLVPFQQARPDGGGPVPGTFDFLGFTL